MTCDIEKTIKIFNERNKKKTTYNQVWFFSAEAFRWSELFTTLSIVHLSLFYDVSSF